MQRTEEPADPAKWVENHNKLYEAAHNALLHFQHMDQANAQIHVGKVRYSPLTFRLAEALSAVGWRSDAIVEVMSHRGAYAEDPGR